MSSGGSPGRINGRRNIRILRNFAYESKISMSLYGRRSRCTSSHEMPKYTDQERLIRAKTHFYEYQVYLMKIKRVLRNTLVK